MAYVPYVLGEVVADEHGNLFRRADGRKVQWEPRKFQAMESTGGGEPGPPGTTDWDGLTNVPAVIAAGDDAATARAAIDAVDQTAFVQAHNASTDLLIDGSFNRDSAWWSGALTTGLSLSTDRAFTGSQSLKVTGSCAYFPNVTSAAKTGFDASYGVIKSEGGRVYRLSCRIWRAVGNTSTGFVRARIGAVGATGTDTLNGLGPTSTVNQSDIPTGEWFEYVNYFKVPYTGTNYPYVGIFPRINTETVDAADVFYIDHVRFEDMTNASAELVAPLPTGDRTIDTRNVQRLVDLAQTFRGTVVLQAGTYACDIVTAKVTNQPRIVGQGKQLTLIDGTIKMQGVSSKFSGGWLSGFKFVGTHDVFLELNGVCDVHWDELRFEGTADTGILLHNELSGDYTELCCGRADFYFTVETALEFRVTSGASSFHGSGLINSSIQCPGTAPAILIGAGARPYNSPLTVGVWTTSSGGAFPVIQHDGDTKSNFFGNLTVEQDAVSALAAGNDLFLAGTVSSYMGPGLATNKGTLKGFTGIQAVSAGAVTALTPVVTADGFVSARASTVTAAGTTALTVVDPQVQVFTGSSTQTVKLPTTGVVAGQSYLIINNSSGGNVTVQTAAANAITNVSVGKAATFTAKIDTPAGAADWFFVYTAGSVTTSGSTTAMRDGNANITANGFIATPVSTATAAGTTTMTAASSQVQVFTGSTTQTVKLPTTSVTPGQSWTVVNNSSGSLTVQSSGANTVATVLTNTLQIFVALVATPATAAHWRAI